MIPQHIAIKAGAWWAGQLHKLPDNDAGSSLLNFALNTSRNNIKPLSEQQIADYQNTLVMALESVEFTSKISHLAELPVTIAVDYKPDLILRVIAKAVGIDNIEKRLSVKTIMRIYEDHIEVKRGYGAPWETI